MFFTHTRIITYVHAAVGGCGLGEHWSFTNICFSNLLSISLSFLLQQSTSSLPCYILECACGNSPTKHILHYCAKTFSIASGDVDTYKIRRRTLSQVIASEKNKYWLCYLIKYFTGVRCFIILQSVNISRCCCGCCLRHLWLSHASIEAFRATTTTIWSFNNINVFCWTTQVVYV